MQLSEDINPNAYIIRAYEPGKIQVNDKVITNSIIITPTELINPWPPTAFDEISSQNLAQIIPLKPEIVIIGTGLKLHFLDTALLAAFYEQQIGVEMMDTAAACRTYDVLVAEGRKVAAGLIV